MPLTDSLLSEAAYSSYLDALLVCNRAHCQRTVEALLQAGLPVYELYEQLFTRSLCDVGRLWETNRISVAVEHLATSLTESLLSLTYPRIFATPRIGRRIVMACVAGELHPIGAKMAADICELHGWDSAFLGANLPLADLLSLLEQGPPDLLGLSVCLSDNLPTLQKTLAAVNGAFPDLQILIGGRALRHADGQKLLKTDLLNGPAIRYIPDLATLIAKVLQT